MEQMAEQAGERTSAAGPPGIETSRTVEGDMDTTQVESVQANTPTIHQTSESWAGNTAGISKESEAEESEEDDSTLPGQVNLGSGYAQSRATREAVNRRIVVDISFNENASVSSTLGGDRVGSMDRGIDESIEKCFNGVLVIQYCHASRSSESKTHLSLNSLVSSWISWMGEQSNRVLAFLCPFLAISQRWVRPRTRQR